MRSPFIRLWGAAIVIGLFTTVGLLSGLIGDGIWDLLSALALSVPVVVAVWFGFPRRSGIGRSGARDQ